MESGVAEQNDVDAILAAVGRARDGDLAAFEEVYRTHVNRVYTLCLRLLADVGRAEEMTQDVFVRAWEKLRTFRGESVFSTWLHRLAVNLVMDRLRAEKRRGAWMAMVANLAQSDHTSHVPGHTVRVDLERAISELPLGARTIFVLHDIEGYQHAEIAKLTGLAEGTSKAQLHRARHLLREALE